MGTPCIRANGSSSSSSGQASFLKVWSLPEHYTFILFEGSFKSLFGVNLEVIPLFISWFGMAGWTIPRVRDLSREAIILGSRKLLLESIILGFDMRLSCIEEF